MEKIKQEDYNAYLQNQRKKAINKQYMESAYIAKAKKLQEEKEYEEFENEKNVNIMNKQQKERENITQKCSIQEEKDRIFNRLSAEKAHQKQKKIIGKMYVMNYIFYKKKKNRLKELEE